MKTIGVLLLTLIVSMTGLGQAGEFTYSYSVWWDGDKLYASGTAEHDDGESVTAESYIEYPGGQTSTDSDCDYFVATTTSTMTASAYKIGKWLVTLFFAWLLDEVRKEVGGELAQPVTGFTFGDLIPPYYQHRRATESCPGPGGSVDPAICQEGVTTGPIYNPWVGQDYLKRKYWAWKIRSGGWGCHQTSHDTYGDMSSSQYFCTDGT